MNASLFPQPRFKPEQDYCTGANTCYSNMRFDLPDFIDVGHSLDAPHRLPQGSHDSMVFGAECVAFSYVGREVPQ